MKLIDRLQAFFAPIRIPYSCGNHPGMSCVEKHEDDAFTISVLTREIQALTKKVERRRKK